jgi:multidrug efflux pump subunit AcrA (membrane-fusion protein)
MNAPLWFLISVAAAGLVLAGCGRKASSGHDHAEHAEGGKAGESGVAFKEGRGLRLSPEVIQALGLTTAEAAERPLAATLDVITQVIATGGRVLANARLPVEQTDLLEKFTLTGARLVQIDRAAAAATRLVDLVFELDAPATHQVGDFVTLRLAGEPAAVLTVPHSAVLDGATGTFVYVVNGDAYLRTPVTVVARSAHLLGISDGLYAGDVVVVTPVDQLWLAELRLTKGGGHSH